MFEVLRLELLVLRAASAAFLVESTSSKFLCVILREEISGGPPPFGLPPSGLPPIGLPPFGLREGLL